MTNENRQRLVTIFLVALIILGGAVYLPGMSGPWLFDDFANIVNNSYLQLTHLSLESLKLAAFSLQAGPLHRPLAMLSFALTYYFTGSFASTTPFKLTNIAIHIINGLLVFRLSFLIFRQAARLENWRKDTQGLDEPTVLAGILALWWLVHPIQLTAVLYVVQRETSMAALFVLLALIGYVQGRLDWNRGQRQRGLWIALGSMAVFGLAGLFSKENAALLPLFALAIDFTVFGDHPPWSTLARLPRRTRLWLWAALAAAVILVGILAILHFAPQYWGRDFTLTERALTEARVLFFYLALLVYPRIDWFGGQHDDITISHSLLHPWTTLPSVIGIAILLLGGLSLRRRAPLVSLGILWFFFGHALESTIIPLEIAQEHRNYLPSLGILLAITSSAAWLARTYRSRVPLLILTLLVSLTAAVTAVRAWQWSNTDSYDHFEALHHPNSPRAQAGLGSLYAAEGKFDAAIAAFGRASALSPLEPGYQINRAIVISWRGDTIPRSDQQALTQLLRKAPITPLTQITLQYAVNCLPSRCKTLKRPLEAWLRTILQRLQARRRPRSLYEYLLGRTLVAEGRDKEAVAALQRSHAEDHNYLHPLFAIVELYVERGQKKLAQEALAQLSKANHTSLYPRDHDLKIVAAQVAAMSAKPPRSSRKR